MFAIRGVVDAETARELEQPIHDAGDRRSREVVVDLLGATRIEHEALAAFSRIHTLLQRRGGSLQIVCSRTAIRNSFRAAGLEELLDFSSTTRAALSVHEKVDADQGGGGSSQASNQHQQGRRTMLELTADAAEAIEGILAAPGLPESAGMRIAPAEGISLEAETGDVQVAVAEAPSETDEVIEADGALVFVDEAVADLVDDKVLDAMIVGDRVGFTLNVQ